MKIITLTLNPAFDVHCHVKNFAPFHENLAKITDREAGGKGVNISRALTKNSVENLAFVVLGEENAADFRLSLENDGMTFKELVVPGRIRENITVHTDNADETRISFAGFDTDDTLLDKTEKVLSDIIEEGSIVTFTGRVPTGLSMPRVKDFLRCLESRGARIVIDSRSFTLDDLIEMRPWLIKPNGEEIGEYLGREIESFAQVVSAAGELYGKGIENVMISLGAKGALLVCREGVFVATPPSVEALSTIGAGDSSIGGFIAAAARNVSADEMLRTAVSFGTAACMTAGTRPPEPGDVRDIYSKVMVKKI